MNRSALIIVSSLLAVSAGCKHTSSNGDQAGTPSEAIAVQTATVESAFEADPEKVAAAFKPATAYGRPGYSAYLQDGRLWIFSTGSQEQAEFEVGKEPAKHITRIGAGPAGLTVKAVDSGTLSGYFAAREGFVTELVDGRIWAFHEDAPELETFKRGGELAKHVTRIGVGPGNTTVKAPDSETILAYVAAREGFRCFVDDGRLWVFADGISDLKAFAQGGEPAKHVTRIGAGPMGCTIKAPDAATLQAYEAAVEGFRVFSQEGRIWVFRSDCEELPSFLAGGELAKRVTRIGAGPNGATLLAPDSATLDSYLRAFGNEQPTPLR